MVPLSVNSIMLKQNERKNVLLDVEIKVIVKLITYCDELIDENTKYKKRLDFKVTEKEKKHYLLHTWIPKMHKNPTGARFSIAFKIFSAKQFSKSVSNIFKLIYSQIESFPKHAKFLSNYNKFWGFQNADPIIQ